VAEYGADLPQRNHHAGGRISRACSGSGLDKLRKHTPIRYARRSGPGACQCKAFDGLRVQAAGTLEEPSLTGRLAAANGCRTPNPVRWAVQFFHLHYSTNVRRAHAAATPKSSSRSDGIVVWP